MYYLKNQDKEQWIEDCIERKPTGARKRVKATEAAVQQQQEDMKNAENAELTNREPEKTFQEMMVALGECWSERASSDDGEDREDEDDEKTEQGKLSEDDEPGWVIGTVSKMVRQLIERFPQRQMKLHELTQPTLEDAADHFCETDQQ